MVGGGAFPSLHHCKEGWPSSDKIAKHPLLNEAGVVFRMSAKGKPPWLRLLRWLREILLVTQPPLLLLRLRAAALALRGGDARREITHRRRLSRLPPESGCPRKPDDKPPDVTFKYLAIPAVLCGIYCPTG